MRRRLLGQTTEDARNGHSRPQDGPDGVGEPLQGTKHGLSGSRGLCGEMRLTLPYPPSTNHLYRNARAKNGKTIRVKTQAAKGYQANAANHVTAWCLEFGDPPPPPYRLTIVLYPRTARRIDVSNGIKCLEDGIFAGLGRNDRQVDEVRIRAEMVDPAYPRADVTLEGI